MEQEKSVYDNLKYWDFMFEEWFNSLQLNVNKEMNIETEIPTKPKLLVRFGFF